jgi:hypothetical protein
MSEEQHEELLNGDVTVVFRFHGEGPTFGDLFRITGEAHPRFPSAGGAVYEGLASLGFQQMDDYFAVLDRSGEPAIWLYPMVDGHPVDHHPGPFSAIQIDFNVLAQPVAAIPSFLAAVDGLARGLAADPLWGSAREPVSRETLVATARARIEVAVRYWQERGITPGTEEAVELSCQ